MKEHDEERGLGSDLKLLLSRRDVMRWALGSSFVSLVGCDGLLAAIQRKHSGGGAAADGGVEACTAIPEETGGPFPADGSNNAMHAGPPPGGFHAGPPPGFHGGPPPNFADGPPPGFHGGPPPDRDGPPPNMQPPGMMHRSRGDAGTADRINALVLSGIVRSDIRSSVAGASAVADGVPLRLQLKLVDAANGCKPLSGLAVYIWHCDSKGDYSLYSRALASENYLRGVQATDRTGHIEFTTIVPGCYAGRWPHIHVEVYPSLASATQSANKLATSQFALPQTVCDLAYAEPGYENSSMNLTSTTLTSDMVFADGYGSELLNVTGSVAHGFAATLTFGIKPS